MTKDNAKKIKTTSKTKMFPFDQQRIEVRTYNSCSGTILILNNANTF